jgi:uncharacterized protein YjbI with pentapeptide repeats
MKVATPIIPLKLESGTPDLFIDDATLEGLQFAAADLTGISARNVTANEVVLDRCILLQAKLEKFRGMDLRMQHIDATAARCADASLLRSSITKCRMAGIDLSTSLLKEVTFEDCNLDLANFRYATLTRVQFIDCVLAEADFIGATLNHVTFVGCTLERTAFSQCKVTDVDLRGAHIISVSGWQSLKGATIDTQQLIAVAPQMAAELGLEVK